MKRLLFAVLFTLCAVPALAAETPPGWPPAVDGIQPPTREIDYISPKTVPLNNAEKKALRLSSDWSRRTVEPLLADQEKVEIIRGVK
jgi:hypothetical protein